MSLDLQLQEMEKYFLIQEFELQKKINNERDIEKKKEYEIEKEKLIEEKKRKIKLYLKKEKEILLEMGCKTLSEGFLLKKVKLNTILMAFEKTKYLSKDIIKKLKKALSKTRQLAIQDLKSLLIPSGLIKLIMKDLLRSKLTMLEVRLLTRFLKKLMINLFKKPYLSLNIKEIRYLWIKLPLSIRRLIMAIIILKQEMIHKFSLDLENMKMKLLKEKNFSKRDSKVISLNEEQKRLLFLPDVWIKLERQSDQNKNKIIKKKTNATTN